MDYSFLATAAERVQSALRVNKIVVPVGPDFSDTIRRLQDSFSTLAIRRPAVISVFG
jgi:hypothetical protein